MAGSNGLDGLNAARKDEGSRLSGALGGSGDSLLANDTKFYLGDYQMGFPDLLWVAFNAPATSRVRGNIFQLW